MSERFQFDMNSSLYVSVAGSLDATSSGDFETNLMGKIEEKEKPMIVLDLQQLEFINSLGLASIVKVWKEVRADNGSLRILVTEKIAKIFQVANLDTIIDMYVLRSLPQKSS